MKFSLKNIGPGAIVSAAFIGPGTVTTSTLTGAEFGYTLLWVVTFSIIATYVLQEMSARLGVVGKLGLGEALRNKLGQGWQKICATTVVLSVILVGNAAYEAGNITGAVIGFDSYPYFTEKFVINPLIVAVGIAAFLVLYFGKYRQVEMILVFLVGTMGIIFTVLAVLLKPEYWQILKDSFVPIVPEGSLVMIMSIIGTTVVPYNLFLHASSVKEKWQGEDFLTISRWDSFIGIFIGGIITMAILITSTIIFKGSGIKIEKASDLAIQLKPALGEWSAIFIALGYLSAGFASAITAPLAAAYATSEMLGWNKSWHSTTFRLVWMTILGIGIYFSCIGIKPMKLILFAQLTNGLLLPIIATFLLWIMNDVNIMGKHKNAWLGNISSIVVILFTIWLSILTVKSIL